MPRRRRRSSSPARAKAAGPSAAERLAWSLANPHKAADGWYMDGQGYIARTIRVRGKRVTQREHRTVMESVIGRKLTKGETVHHRNGVRSDNHPGNLELWVTAQPAGQRPHELLAYAHEIIARYGHAVDQGDSPTVAL